ncbi:hypothetical protein ATCV1_z810L [Acanthocystis turfacea chlorella virus 1]|uniref:Uncharacterized protein z810L n=1 Tax=Chlorovirus heliozoae TaxID=322019 RepID=A7KA70_9PHYC|nr:hypothetical protein ATCV1_z810L [Acanthocystis turfacea chlorella virus 1]ABT16944.1 hypothetical protein ATCV1_z810L [Acanthocystis turfacea chlorella virus 1]
MLSTCPLVSSSMTPCFSHSTLSTLRCSFNICSISPLERCGFLPPERRHSSVVMHVPSPSTCTDPPSRTNPSVRYTLALATAHIRPAILLSLSQLV